MNFTENDISLILSEIRPTGIIEDEVLQNVATFSTKLKNLSQSAQNYIKSKYNKSIQKCEDKEVKENDNVVLIWNKEWGTAISLKKDTESESYCSLIIGKEIENVNKAIWKYLKLSS